MVTAIRLSRTGGPEVLAIHQGARAVPGPGEAWIRQDAIGLNFLDVMQRRGDVAIPIPGGLGVEAAGEVIALGDGVSNVAVGDRVAYAMGPIGAYASARVYPADRLIRLPDDVTADVAAAILLKGLTAQYLLKSTFPVGPCTTIVLYGASGGLGQIMVPWARSLGAFVIGVVSKPESVARAHEIGCDAVRVWGGCDLPTEVAALTGGRMADVVYDGVGRITFQSSLECLRPRGLLASIGASSGPPPPIELSTLNARGSLFVTRAGLPSHIASHDEYLQRADDVWKAHRSGIINSAIWRTFPLAEAARAHADLEAGRVAGPMLLLPQG